jgi:hypothetical protein
VIKPGDFTGDGILDTDDLPEFVDHLLEYANDRPCAADVNLDGFIDGMDVGEFVLSM